MNQSYLYRIARKGSSLGTKIDVAAPDGTLVIRLRGKPFTITKESYEVVTRPGIGPFDVKQETNVRGPEFSIYADNVKVGSAGVTTGHGKGFIYLAEMPQIEISFGWGFKRELSLDSPNGTIGQVFDDGRSWSVQLKNKNHNQVFLLGLAIIYGEYLKRG